MFVDVQAVVVEAVGRLGVNQLALPDDAMYCWLSSHAQVSLFPTLIPIRPSPDSILRSEALLSGLSPGAELT